MDGDKIIKKIRTLTGCNIIICIEYRASAFQIGKEFDADTFYFLLKVRYKNKKFTFETQKDNKLLVFGILINYDTNLKFLFFSKKQTQGLF